MSVPYNFVSPPECPLPRGEDLCRLCAQGGGCCCGTDPAVAHLCFPLSPPEWRRLLPYAHLATQTPFSRKKAFAAEEKRLRFDLAPHPETAEFSTREEPGQNSADGRKSANADPSSNPSFLTPPAGGDAVCVEEDNSPGFTAAMRRLFPGGGKRVGELFPEGGRHLRLRTRADGSCVFWGSEGCRLPRRARPWYCLLFPGWVQGTSVTLFTSEGCLISGRAAGPAHGLALMNVGAEDIRALHARLCRDWGLGG